FLNTRRAASAKPASWRLSTALYRWMPAPRPAHGQGSKLPRPRGVGVEPYDGGRAVGVAAAETALRRQGVRSSARVPASPVISVNLRSEAESTPETRRANSLGLVE